MKRTESCWPPFIFSCDLLWYCTLVCHWGVTALRSVLDSTRNCTSSVSVVFVRPSEAAPNERMCARLHPQPSSSSQPSHNQKKKNSQGGGPLLLQLGNSNCTSLHIFFFFFCQKPPCKILSLRHFSVEVLEHLSMKISAGGGGRQAGRAADEQGKTANRFSPHRTPLLRFLPCLLAPRISAESMKSLHNEAPAGTTMVRPRLLRRVYVFRVTLGGFFWLGGWRRKTGPVIKTPLSDDVLSQTERRTEREGIRGREEQTGGSSN